MSLYSRITNNNIGPNPLREYNLLYEGFKLRSFQGYSGFSIHFDSERRELNIQWKGSDLPYRENEYFLKETQILYIPIEVELINFIRTQYQIPDAELITVNIGNIQDFNTGFDILKRYKIMVLLVGDISTDIEHREVKTIRNVKFNFPDTWIIRDFYNKNIKNNPFLDRTCNCFSFNYSTTFKLVCDSNIRFENCQFINNGYDQITFGVNMLGLLESLKSGYHPWAWELYHLVPVTDKNNHVVQSILDGNNIIGGKVKYKDTLLDILFDFNMDYATCGDEEKKMLEMINDNPVLRKFAQSEVTTRLFLNSSTGIYCIVQWYSEDRFSGIKKCY